MRNCIQRGPSHLKAHVTLGVSGCRAWFAAQTPPSLGPLLGGSWVVISGVINPLIWVIIIVTLLIIPLITAHEPPSRPHKQLQHLTFGYDSLVSEVGSRGTVAFISIRQRVGILGSYDCGQGY